MECLYRDTLCVLHVDLDVNVIQSIAHIYNIKLEFRELWSGGCELKV